MALLPELALIMTKELGVVYCVYLRLVLYAVISCAE